MNVPAIKLVLLPGMDGTGKLFADFVEVLDGAFETEIVEYPSNRRLSYSELMPLLDSAAPMSEPFVLVAESFSTPLAVQFAATRPSNLLGLVICAGFIRSPLRATLRVVALLLSPILFRMTPSETAIRSFLVGSDAPSLLVHAVQTAVSSVQQKVLSARLRAILSSDVRSELGRVVVPILYIQAKQDRLVTASALEEILRIKPETICASIDAPHLLVQREPQRVAEIVSGFIRRLV